ncbi:transcriptional regulator with XRE-family HTH domain [Epilithonimonas hungarica]|uniref:helix-turn-helix domain-containing protein n=1 Tax=Epilithonimonas hungarica TaxID=454006 RepID=UPI0027845F09|nr:helix-turn-helix transcriptional regulator [Epilithonimonas hungarica]MDP9958100.1 transcriptional regulator with XRE-family HTH domain [Epilithonimonas hungarica]
MEKQEILISVGSKIKEIRQNKGLSQLDLVGKMDGNIDVTNISRIEKGRTNPTVYTLFRIALALEVHPKEFLEIQIKES